MNFIKAIPPKMLKDRLGVYSGGNRTGWNAEMDRCWIDNDANICVTSRLIRTKSEPWSMSPSVKGPEQMTEQGKSPGLKRCRLKMSYSEKTDSPLRYSQSRRIL